MSIRHRGPGGGAGLLLALSLVLALTGCDQPSANNAGKAAPKGAPPPAVVTASQPIVREIVEWDEYTARFDAVEQVEVRARVSGYLTTVAFKDGQMVKKGDLLYEIDPRPFERALEQARAEFAQAKTKAENAMLDVERGRPLAERKVLSEKAFDDRANVLRDAQAGIKVAEAKVATAELDLAFTRMTSPINGRISRSQVTAGNWISAGTVANASTLTTIVAQDPVYVYFDISEANYLKYKRLAQQGSQAGAAATGGIVELAMADEQSYPHKGRLDFIDNRLDQGTATLRVRAVLENKAGLFSPGMFARVRIPGSQQYAATMLPDTAIGTDQASKFVLVVAEDGTVARRPVQLGPLSGGLRVVRAGLKSDELVVTKGLQRARPGTKVDAKREAIVAPPAAALPPPGPAPAAAPAPATKPEPAKAPAAAPTNGQPPAQGAAKSDAATGTVPVPGNAAQRGTVK